MSRPVSPVINGAAESNGLCKVKVALLWSSAHDESGIPQYPPDGFPMFNPDEEKFHFEVIHLEKATAIKSLQKMIKGEEFDVYVNICDGFEQHDNAGVEVAEFLHRQCDVPFISATPEFYLISKFQMKFIAKVIGIPTPKFCFIYNEHLYDANRKYLLNSIKFPMIVKHHNSGGSEGVTENSLVWDEEQLKMRIHEMTKEHGGALIEEFIRGIEYTVLVQENPADENSPIVYPPHCCLMPGDGNGFKHETIKFLDNEKILCRIVEDENLANRLRSMTKKIFLACHANTYARCDYRQCSRTGAIYFLEINNMPCLFLADKYRCMGDVILRNCRANKLFFQNALECALKFHKKSRERFQNLSSNHQPYCGYAKAKKCIKKHHVIIDFTQLPHTKLVNRSQFSRFCPEFRDFFMATSLAISANLRLWLYNCWQPMEDLDVLAFERSSLSKKSNCFLDEDLRLIAKVDINAGERFVLD